MPPTTSPFASEHNHLQPNFAALPIAYGVAMQNDSVSDSNESPVDHLSMSRSNGAEDSPTNSDTGPGTGPQGVTGNATDSVQDLDISNQSASQQIHGSAESRVVATNRLPAMPSANPPEELLRRASVTNDHAKLISTSQQRSRPKYPELQLSGNVISATFCVPHKIDYSNGDWNLRARGGTSALFDSFSYLASDQSKWKHTLVGWTGEIDNLPKCAAAAAAPIPINAQAARLQLHEAAEMRIPAADRESLRKILEKEHCGKVELVWPADEMDDEDTYKLRDQQCWKRYGEHNLFSLFHYKQIAPSDGRAMKKSWLFYLKMNEAFADAIVAIYKPGDVVLVHDYQLMLLPAMLRQRIPNMYIAFFLHIPFPDFESYRCLSTRKQILQGVLGANMIGFQEANSLKHFSMCCHRLLDLESSAAGVDYGAVNVALDVFPIGIDTNKTHHSAFGSSEVAKKIEDLRNKHEGKKIIVGRDRLDSLRGVAQKLGAFEIFLARYPGWHNKVVLIQVTSPTSIDDHDEEREKTESKIAELVARINGNFGSLSFTPVEYYSQYLSKDEYFALLRLADLGLIASVRDGMNTTALEYVLCQEENQGPLIISEFSGTAVSLGSAMHINPWDLKGVAVTINRALTIPEDERSEAYRSLSRHVIERDVKDWTDKLIKRLLTNLAAFDDTYTTPVLDRIELVNRYRNSTRRLFLFDYDGTLTPIVQDPEAAIPTDIIICTLKTLVSDPNNSVWIISGRDQEFLDKHFGHISALGLSAEHGCFVRMPSPQDSTQATGWEDLTVTLDKGWQKEVEEVVDRYTNETPGASKERKKIAITWHYRQAHPELGSSQAQKCKEELEKGVATRWEVEVMTGKANVEVRPKFVNKGEIVKRLVKAYGNGEDEKPDFVFCLGDDHTDEDMFRSLRNSTLNDDHVFATTIGAPTKQTLAKWHLPEPTDVIAALTTLNSSRDAADDGAGAFEAQL